MKKEYKKVILDCQQAKELDPDFIKIYFREGNAYMELKEYGEAAASYWEGLKRDSKNKEFKKRFNKAIKMGKKQHKEKLKAEMKAKKKAEKAAKKNSGNVLEKAP